MSVHFQAAPEVVFDYLVDPANRAEWQSSLRRVEEVAGSVGVGQTWVDVTTPGLRPRMETTELARPRHWTEIGIWRSVSATLTLTLTPAGAGCDVEPTMRLEGRGLARLVAPVLNLVSPGAVRSDLRRAARILARTE